MYSHGVRSCFFFFNDTATTEIYTLSLHDALPILRAELAAPGQQFVDPNTFNGLFSVHASLMIFLFIIPVFAGIANFVLPLMIGAPDMAFPQIGRAHV